MPKYRIVYRKSADGDTADILHAKRGFSFVSVYDARDAEFVCAALNAAAEREKKSTLPL